MQQQHEVFIWKWDPNVEALVSLNGCSSGDVQEAMRYKANLGSLWTSGKLFRYRSRAPNPGNDESEQDQEQEGRRNWARLTSYISPGLLSRIVGGHPAAVDVDGRPRWSVSSATSAHRDADVIPGLAGDAQHLGLEEEEFSFLPVDLKRTWREGAVGRERTESAQDRSWALGDLISRYPDDGEGQILGELQFTFLMVLTMMNYSCLQQWKRLLGLILTCRSAIRTREFFMANVVGLLFAQLLRCDDVEGGLFELDGDGGGEFLRRLLMKFKWSVDEMLGVSPSTVKVELERLESWLRDECRWDLDRAAIVRRGMVQLEDGEEVELEIGDDEDEETGEYAPVVVEMEGHGHAPG